MRYIRQHSVNDCGPACLAMIASHHGSYISLGEARKLCKTDAMGTNLTGLVQAAEKLGFDTQALKGEKTDTTLNADIIFPFIAHIETFRDGSPADHFVVVKSISKKSVEIWDPNPGEKRRFMPRDKFLEVWTGYVLFISPSATFTPNKEKDKPLLKYLPLLFPHKKEILVTCLASGLLIALGIVTAFYYTYIVDEVLVTRAMFSLFWLSLGVLTITVVQSLVEAFRTLLISHFSFKVALRMEMSYVFHVLKLPASFFDSMMTGDIMARRGDLSRVGSALSGTTFTLIMDTLLLLVVGPILFSINPTLFLICTANVLIVGIIIFIFSKVYRRIFTRLRQEEAKVSSELVEIIGGARTVKAMNAEGIVFNSYEKRRMAAQWTGWKANNLQITQGLVSGVVSGTAGIALFWAGASGIINDVFSLGAFMGFNALAGYFTGPLFRLVNIQASLQEAYVAAERVSEILETEPEQEADDERLTVPSTLNGGIEFKDVSFRYGTRELVYSGLSFRIEKGQRAAFVGPSGCGKSTLVKLLLKFYQPEKGSVFINNQDLRYMDVMSLRSKIGYVPQDIFIFAGTIKDNIALRSPDADMADIVKAAQRAGADVFIDALPEKYNTRLGEFGAILSGGERQRLALARALLGKPDILILDEATSSLDTISERNIHNAIEEFQEGITTLIIAHRLSTIRDCDIIFVMEKGSIIEFGSHDELIMKNGLYKKMLEER